MRPIAISYRRGDATDITFRIYERLKARYGEDKIFLDLATLRPAAHFPDEIKKNFEGCAVVLVIVSPNWPGRVADGHSRIHDAEDFVRKEVETGLNRDVPVIPVLVGGASIPNAADLPESLKGLVTRQAVRIDSGRDFDYHAEGLVREMDQILEGYGVKIPPPKPQSSSAGVTVGPILQAAAYSLMLAALVRLSQVLGYPEGPLAWLGRNPLNSAEVIILIGGATAVGVGTLMARPWARMAGVMVCAFGILDGLFFLVATAQSTSSMIRLGLYTAIYLFGLVAYAFFWNAPEGARRKASG